MPLSASRFRVGHALNAAPRGLMSYGPSLQDGYRQAGLADEPEADVQEPSINVRLSGQSRHHKSRPSCLFLTLTGHRQLNIAAVRLGPKPHFVSRKLLL
jgi:hypothetical protein